MGKRNLVSSFLLGAFCWLTAACSGDVPPSAAVTAPQLQKKLAEKKISILYFWTSWCDISQHILNETYMPLADSLVQANYDAQVILLCGSAGVDSLVKAFNRPGLQSYYLDNAGNGNGFVDRRAIKKYIESLFPGQQFQELEAFGYGIPLTFIVNPSAAVSGNGPQDLESLLTILKQ